MKTLALPAVRYDLKRVANRAVEGWKVILRDPETYQLRAAEIVTDVSLADGLLIGLQFYPGTVTQNGSHYHLQQDGRVLTAPIQGAKLLWCDPFQTL